MLGEPTTTVDGITGVVLTGPHAPHNIWLPVACTNYPSRGSQQGIARSIFCLPRHKVSKKLVIVPFAASLASAFLDYVIYER